jgi:hypothetical protein
VVLDCNRDKILGIAVRPDRGLLALGPDVLEFGNDPFDVMLLGLRQPEKLHWHQALSIFKVVMTGPQAS